MSFQSILRLEILGILFKRCGHLNIRAILVVSVVFEVVLAILKYAHLP